MTGIRVMAKDRERKVRENAGHGRGCLMAGDSR